MFEADDLVVGNAVAAGAGFFPETLGWNEKGAGEAVHRLFEVDGGIAGGADDPVREFVGKSEAFALDIDSVGNNDRLSDRLAALEDVAR